MKLSATKRLAETRGWVWKERARDEYGRFASEGGDAGGGSYDEPVQYKGMGAKKAWRSEAIENPTEPQPGISHYATNPDTGEPSVEADISRVSSVVRQDSDMDTTAVGQEMERLEEDGVERETGLAELTQNGQEPLATAQAGVYTEVLKEYVDNPELLDDPESEPLIYELADGSKVVGDGHHRIVAAEHLQRDLKVRVFSERE